MKKIEKQSIPNMKNLFMMVKHFGFSKPSSGLYDGEKNVTWTAMDVFIKITGEE